MPWFTDCDTRKKSYLNEENKFMRKQSSDDQNKPLRQSHVAVNNSSAGGVGRLSIHPGNCVTIIFDKYIDVTLSYLKNLVLILLLTMM